jgi:hypothetical protein
MPPAPLRGIPDLLTCPAVEVERRLEEQSPLLERRSVR